MAPPETPGYRSTAEFLAAVNETYRSRRTSADKILTPAEIAAQLVALSDAVGGGQQYVTPADLEAVESALSAASTALVTTAGDVEKKYKLGILWGALAMRTVLPVSVVGLGSSTMAGSGATSTDARWFNLLATQLQGMFPSGQFSESPVGTLATTPVTAPGLHFYNGGIGGTRSNTYLTDAMVATIGTIAPRAVLHMVGSNDLADGASAALYRSRLTGWLDKLDAAVPAPYVNILFHAHKRLSGTDALYDEYRQVLREFAATRPNCVVVEADKYFRPAGVPYADGMDLMSPDNVHLTQRGHWLLYRLTAVELGFGMVPVTSGGTPTVNPAAVQRQVLFSDVFTGTDGTNLNGRTPDNQLGGTQTAPWVGAALTTNTITANTLTRPTGGNTFFFGFPMAIPDYEISYTLLAYPTADSLTLSVRRQSSANDSPADFRLSINNGGSWTFQRRGAAGGIVALATASGAFVLGDRVGLRVKGTTITALRNGEVVATGTYTGNDNPTPGWTGLAGTANAINWAVDNVSVSAVL